MLSQETGTLIINRFNEEWGGIVKGSEKFKHVKEGVPEDKALVYHLYDVRFKRYTKEEGQVNFYAYTIVCPNGRIINFEIFQATNSRDDNLKCIQGVLNL